MIPTMSPFHAVFPEIAKRETRSLIVVNKPGLPAGTYTFVESYCTDPDCDCRRVLLQVMDDDATQVATISYAFEPPDVDDDLGMPGQVFLDSFNPQSDDSEAILDAFCQDVLNDRYHARLERHYALFKAALADPNDPVHDSAQAAPSPSLPEEPFRRTQRKIGRNDPCPCGSGRKYKKCCLDKR